MITYSLPIIARNKKKIFESINPYHNYLITISKEIHNQKKNYIVRIWYNGDWIKEPEENQYNQYCALNDPKSWYKANYILNMFSKHS